MKKRIINYFAQITTLLLIIGFGGWSLWYGYRILKYEETNNAQIEQYITPIACRAMGYVSEIRCSDNQMVAKGDTLLIIEDVEYQIIHDKNIANLNKATAEEKIAQQRLISNNIEVDENKSEIKISKIKFQNAEKEYTRVKNLLAKESITQQQYDKVETEYLLAKKSVELAEYQYNKSLIHREELSNQLAVENAQLKGCQNEIDRSTLKLSYTIVRAPYAGRIGKIDIQEGQLLQEGQTITFITNEAAGKWIVANVKETQLSQYQIGKEVSFTVDAVPNHTFKGKIESISPATGTRYSMLPPNNATGNFVRITQRIPVRIEIIDGDEFYNQLLGGMNAYVRSIKD